MRKFEFVLKLENEVLANGENYNLVKTEKGLVLGNKEQDYIFTQEEVDQIFIEGTFRSILLFDQKEIVEENREYKLRLQKEYSIALMNEEEHYIKVNGQEVFTKEEIDELHRNRKIDKNILDIVEA